MQSLCLLQSYEENQHETRESFCIVFNISRRRVIYCPLPFIYLFVYLFIYLVFVSLVLFNYSWIVDSTAGYPMQEETSACENFNDIIGSSPSTSKSNECNVWCYK